MTDGEAIKALGPWVAMVIRQTLEGLQSAQPGASRHAILMMVRREVGAMDDGLIDLRESASRSIGDPDASERE